ncbi:MAG: hypothetical protein HC819_19400 [Cyclobacteriaceae bacterium]|nr:hypothetical protein [Cyclobacteriaceae bacterium]
MSKKKTRTQVIKKRILAISLRVALFFVLLLISSIAILSIPSVQTRLINKLSDSIFIKIKHNVDLGYLNIRWFDTILIKDLVVYDSRNRQMIKAERVILDFKITDIFKANSISLDKAILQGASVDMLKNGPEGQFNLNYFIDEIKDQLIRKKPGRKSKSFIAHKIILVDSRFNIYRDDKQVITERFDQYHFTLKKIDASVSDFIIKAGTVAFTVNELQGLDSATHLDIKQIKTNFLYSRQSMVFQNMELHVGNSRINQSMVFNYLQPSSIKEFVDSVNITANVKNSIIYSKDLGQFVPALKKHSQYYRLKGFIEGPVSRMSASNISLQFGSRSEIKGYINTYGLPDLSETFINAKVNIGKIEVDDMAPYLSSESLINAQKFGYINFEGGFSGFIGDFVSNASFKTSIGDFDTDINLKLPRPGTASKPSYTGRLSTREFDLGRFFSDTVHYQTLDLDGSIKGSGFTKQNAKFDLVSNIKSIGINGYNYKNIKTDAVLANEFFNGNLIIDDPNLQFSGNLKLDLKEKHEVIQIEANLGKANLDTMKLTTKPAVLSSSLNVDMHGLSLDSIFGDIFLDNTYFKLGDKELFMDRLLLTSKRDSLSRTLKLVSPNLELDIFGDFNYSQLFQDVVDLYHEYQVVFVNQSKEIAAYHASHSKSLSDYYYLDYDINLKNINPVINLFVPDFFISENTRLVGAFTGGTTKKVELHSQINALSINNYTFENNIVEFNTQKSVDTTLVYANYDISSERQFYNAKQVGEDLKCLIDWNGHEIDFKFDFDQANSGNYLHTGGHVAFLKDMTVVSFEPSELKLIDQVWQIAEDNSVSISKKNYDINNLSIYHQDQKITFNGNLSQDPNENLFISIVNFDVKNLNPLFSKRLDGRFNGFIDVRDFFNNREINSRINIRDFSFNNFLVGDIIGISDYDHEKKNFEVKVNVNRRGERTILVEGNIDPHSDADQLNLEATFTDANLNLLEPFFDSYISHTSGQIDGKLNIMGTLKQPLLQGEGITKNGAFTLDYLNARLLLDGKVVLDKNHIDFVDFALTDDLGNKGTIQGRIGHNNFKELDYDFKGRFNRFLVLNTTAKDNELYYGTAYATGDLRIFGKEKILNISANARSEKGTKFFIPLEGSSEVVKEDFINFISIKDTLANTARNESDKMGLSGVNLNLDLDITPDAYCEIIFDLTAGDIIRGRGNGKINLQIDTKGDFNMFGDYEITEGGYNFTLYNIINKEFEIEPGSKISWIGDPYAAILDIRANYEQLASLTPILSMVDESTIRDNPDLNRKYPAKVILDINGNLMAPEIGFDIEVEDYPKNAIYNGVSIEAQMTAFKNKLDTDEQELKRQVFSLIILKNFSPENAFNVGGSVERSVSEFISNQISYWVTQFDENLEVDVDLGSLDNEAFNTFQLRMSYSFWMADCVYRAMVVLPTKQPGQMWPAYWATGR